MNKHFVIVLITILASSFVFSACNSKMNNKKRLAFDSIKVNRVEHLFGDSSKPYCNLIIDMAYPSMADNVALKDTISRSVLTLCLGGEYANLEPKAAVQKYMEQYVANYRKELEPTFKQEADSSVMQWYNYYRAIHGKVKYEKGELLTYCLDVNEYTGGAHNIYASNFENYDLKKMKTLRLNDLFVAGYTNKLTALIIRQLMKDKEVKTQEELTEKGYGSTGSIAPTENFFFDDKGISFFYNVYEIAPFALGTVTIHLSFSQLKGLMNTTVFHDLGLI
jgi:hypothetical protein